MKVFKVTQKLVSNPISDINAEVKAQLSDLGLQVPAGEIAITAGSRGIANIAEITKACGQWLREQGATPFIIPAMGSHNGATAEGQQAMLKTLGITEKSMGMEIRASMDVVKIGSVGSGDVYMDAHAHRSAGVLVLNRIKLHTGFSGPIQSGLVKMMVVGMGKIKSANTFHSTPVFQMKGMLLEMGEKLLSTGKILVGVGILEDGYDQTAEIHAIRPEDILSKEPELVEKHRDYFPSLPVENLDVLIVDEIGKTYSGTGMDTNVIGFRGSRLSEDLTSPVIKRIAALNLSESSQGNATGVGLADFITQALRDRIDERKTFINVFTTGEMARGRIPCTLRDDEEVINKIEQRFGGSRWMIIPNTLHLETLYVSEDLCDELRQHPKCKVGDKAIAVEFQGGKHSLVFD